MWVSVGMVSGGVSLVRVGISLTGEEGNLGWGGGLFLTCAKFEQGSDMLNESR